MVADGEDGWELLDYSWNPKTGVGTYLYERRCEDTSGAAGAGLERTEIKKAQPYHPSHHGWYTGALT